MKKIKNTFVLPRIGITIVLWVLILPVVFGQAQNEYIYSVRAQKGYSNNSLLDYSDALAVKLSDSFPTKELYIKNSDANLFIGLRVEVNESLIGIALSLDADHDQLYAEDFKIVFLNNSKIDGYFVQNSALSLQQSSYFTSSISNITYLTKQYTLIQLSIPFSPNSIPTVDMFIPDPADVMIGIDVYALFNTSFHSWSTGVVTDVSYLDVPSTSSSFSTLVLAGPGKYAVPDFNPVASTSVSSPQTNQNYSSFGLALENKNDQRAAASSGFETEMLVLTMIGLVGGSSLFSKRRAKI